MVSDYNDSEESRRATLVELTKESRTPKIALWLPIVISFLALTLSLFPQINPLNTDYESRAKAGNVDAQMFLAEHYYAVGDIEQSDYWYKIASMKYGKHYATALNNVACIGLTYKYYNEKVFDYQVKAVYMFKDSVYYGNSVAVQNLYTLLKECQAANTPGIDYNKEIIWIIRVADYFDLSIDNVSEEERRVALEGFHLDRNSGIIPAEGHVVYTGVGIFPDDDAFDKYKDDLDSTYKYTSLRYVTANRPGPES